MFPLFGLGFRIEGRVGLGGLVFGFGAEGGFWRQVRNKREKCE